MSGVRVAQAVAEPELGPDVTAMQDVLYEILAEGIDPELSETPIHAIERFLVEHARTPKSAEEFQAFFQQHGIQQGRPAPSAPAPVGELMLPPVAPAAAPLAHVVTLPTGPGLDDAPTPPPSWKPGRATVAVGAALLALVLGLGAVLWHGQQTLAQLEQQVRTAEAKSEAREQELRKLEHQTAGIRSSVAANGELIQRMDHKSDLMLESLLPPEPPPKKRWQRR